VVREQAFRHYLSLAETESRPEVSISRIKEPNQRPDQPELAG